jgi:hypothetical protein
VFTADDGRKLQVTLSIGVAVFPRDAGDFANLKKQADRAAYLAKRLGKNRVCLYQDRQEMIEPNDSSQYTASSGRVDPADREHTRSTGYGLASTAPSQQVQSQ